MASTEDATVKKSIGYYDLDKNIGEGNFAKVRLGKHTLTGEQVAVKIIDKEKLDKASSKKLFREVRIMKLLNHSNVVRLYEVIDTPTELYLVLEYVPGGELFDYLVAHGRMKEKDARKHFRQIVSAVSYCHSMHVIHRDLKAENILLDANMNIKVADFGFANHFTPGEQLNTWCGSPPYAAPELFQGKEYAGPEVDVWSLGVVLYVLVCGSLPFDGSTLPKLRARVIAGKYKVPFHMSPECERLIKKILVTDPSKRATVQHIVDDKWYCEGFETEPKIEAKTMSLTSEQHARVMAEMEEIGIDSERAYKSVQADTYDSHAATYYLLADKLTKKKKSDAPESEKVARDRAVSSQPLRHDSAESKQEAAPSRAAPIPVQQPISQSRPAIIGSVSSKKRSATVGVNGPVNVEQLRNEMNGVKIGSATLGSDSLVTLEQAQKHLQSTEEPRSARFTLSLSTTTTKPRQQVIDEIAIILIAQDIKHTAQGNSIQCSIGTLQFEFELCKVPNLGVYALRYKRQAGSGWEYKDVLSRVLSKLNL